MWPNLVCYFYFFTIFLQIPYLQCQEDKSIIPVIKKCNCKADEILSSTGCRKQTQLQVNIWDQDAKKITKLDLTTLNTTIIQPPQCPDSMKEETIYNLEFISTEGKLVVYSYPDTELYCLEYILTDNNQIFPSIKRCIEKVSLRLCCQTDEYLDASERCTKIPTEKKSTVLNWLRDFNYRTERTTCEKGNTVHQVIKHEQFIDISIYSYFKNIEQKTNGEFCLGVYGDENEMYLGVNFCNSSSTQALNPPPPVVPHCCERNHAFDLLQLKCVPHQESYNFPMDIIRWPSQGIKETIYFPNCSSFNILTFNDSKEHVLATNGTLMAENGDSIPFKRYCLGAVVDNNLTLHTGIVCLIDEEPIPCPWRWNISIACLVISSLFLIATLAVYLGIPKLRRRTGDVCLISELLALLISQITFIVIYTNRRNFSPAGCLAAGVIEIIFFLASFFWLNIMCYDVWSTFRVLRPYSEKVLRKALFFKYSIYGWGIPLAIGIAVIIVEKMDARLRPHFSPDSRCFFSDQDLVLQWLYLYGWILILLLINLALFIHLAFTLFSNYMEQKKQFKRSGGSMKSSKKATSQDIENLKLHGKLFIIMGVPWLIEVFTSFASKETLCYIWFLDLLNLFRGVLIFVIFVCKKSARNLIIETWFPSYKKDKVVSDQSRKTSTMSLSGWLSTFNGRKISKVSMTSGGNLQMEALREERQEQQTIKEEEGEDKIQDANHDARENPIQIEDEKKT